MLPARRSNRRSVHRTIGSRRRQSMIHRTFSSLGYPIRPCSSADRMIWITPDRVFYAGLLGNPSEHVRGAMVVYIALESMIHVNVMGHGWRTTEVAVI